MSGSGRQKKGPEFGGTQETISMHGNMRLFLGLTPFPTTLMYCSDEELENMLLNKLDSIYSQAIDKLMWLGYPRDVVWNAILTSGYVFGDKDILTNIVQHSIDYIKTNESRRNGTDKDPPDAMRKLLMTNFDLGFVSTLMVLGKGSDGPCQTPAEEFEKHLGKSRISVMGFNLTPSEQERLKKDIAKFSVAFQTDMKASFEEIQAEKNLLPGKPSAEQFEWEDSCVDNLMLDGIGTLISDKESTSESVDKKTKMILLLVHDIKEMKDQAKERKEWAKMKVVEAAKRLYHNLLELKALRMEKRKQKTV
ncbi:hypothetical protein TIFTF001_030592 [Ficus carica]|uniref:PIR2-like helical domain-containing protein n=1 Tax=Ficus carica TaxID=3494 RepID=A0AA88DTV0_FICCA|nr:hypothetical protein TIFTF001_030592 [Ficus carica]